MSNYQLIQNQLNQPAVAARLKTALPANISFEKFRSAVLTALAVNPDIANCSPDSIMTAAMKCASDGLLPDGREAAFVKYNTKAPNGGWVAKAQYMPMVYGLIKRMRNSGEISTVNAHVVYSNDQFVYEIVNGEQIINHRPEIIGNRGKPAGAYCIVKLKDGDVHVEFMTIDEIEKARRAGKSADKGPWVDWFDEMAKKTVIHRAAKRVPTSSEVANLLQSDLRVMLNNDEPAQPQQSLADKINQAAQLEYEKAPEAELQAENLDEKAAALFAGVEQ